MRDRFGMRDNIVVFDPTSLKLVNVVPNCSQIGSILGFFRESWKKIECVISRAFEMSEGVSDFEQIRSIVKVEFEKLESQNFLISAFGFEKDVISERA